MGTSGIPKTLRKSPASADDHREGGLGEGDRGSRGANGLPESQCPDLVDGVIGCDVDGTEDVGVIGRRYPMGEVDAHGVVVALPQGVVDVIGPVETPDVGDRGHQAEDGREDDDGDDGDKAVADRLEVLVAGDRVEKGLALFDGGDELLHA